VRPIELVENRACRPTQLLCFACGRTTGKSPPLLRCQSLSIFYSRGPRSSLKQLARRICHTNMRGREDNAVLIIPITFISAASVTAGFVRLL
jgi:hypothetical protein